MQLVVNTQGTRLKKEGERLVMLREGAETQSVPLNLVEQVVLAGHGVSATTPLLYDMVARGIDVVYQSAHGRFGFRLVGPLAKHSALRVKQIQVATDPEPALALARRMVAGKLHNQAVILRRYLPEQEDTAVIRLLGAQMRQAETAGDAEALRGYEGSGAAAYFGVWPRLFDARHWGFHGRAYHPAPDPVNAMLGLGYTMLLNEIVGAMYRIGLDPMVGVFHTLDYGRPSLALDLEEEFRPVIVDTLVLRIARERYLEPGDFSRRGAGCVMSDDARRFFFERYEERLLVRVRHPAWDQQLTLRQCIQRQVEHLARCFEGRDEGYTPLTIR
jgi:CRISP-associated protein Cas1